MISSLAEPALHRDGLEVLLRFVAIDHGATAAGMAARTLSRDRPQRPDEQPG